MKLDIIRFLFLLIFILLISNCGDELIDNTSNKIFVNYYSLDVGNYWEYSGVRISSEGKVLDTTYYSFFVEKDTSINKINYKKVICKNIPENQILKISYERIDPLVGKAFMFDGDAEFLIDDFDAKIQEWYDVSITGLRTIIGAKKAHVKLKEIKDSENGKTQLYFASAIMFEDEYALTEKWGFMYYHAHGSGHNFGGYSYNLVYANIQGVEYGKRKN